MNMYKNLGQETQRNITGNREADRVYIEQFEKLGITNKAKLKKILWKNFKNSFKTKSSCLSVVK